MLATKLQEAAGNATQPSYIEDVFSTYLYTGNGSTQTITNGIDLAGKGGLVWLKSRSGTANNELYDSARVLPNALSSNNTAIQVSGGISSFLSSGFNLNSSVVTNLNAATYASWTFRKQPKFFDVVTYTGNGVTGRTVAHNLGSVPGCIIVKRTDTTGNWQVYHRGLTSASYGIQLNSTAAQASNNSLWVGTAPTATEFTLGLSTDVNASGGTYVAYIFAHNAGGFGLTGTDNVISCGSYAGNNGTQEINLGYEPQWILLKKATGIYTYDWVMFDTMRGWTMTADQVLSPNLSEREYNFETEYAGNTFGEPTATGFRLTSGYEGTNATGSTYIYIAIRRGPMKVPTDGTKVFSPNAVNATTGTAVTTNFPVDLQLATVRDNGTSFRYAFDRLRGISTNATESGQSLALNLTNAEQTSGSATLAWGNQGFQISSAWQNANDIFWNFRRAPGFFDEICYTGNGSSARALSHNLGVAPELAIFKMRSSAGYSWIVVQKNVCTTPDQILALNLDVGLTNISGYFSATGGFASAVTSTTLNNIGSGGAINGSGSTYVAYLFASCPGVSKVGSYTGTGTTLQINCGFTGGARFVLIKRTDSTGDWYVWDSARGIVTGNDPYLLLNSTAAEVTTTDYIDPYSAGFEISSTAPAAINASGGSFIYLAIA